jgi:hypothetical protein
LDKLATQPVSAAYVGADAQGIVHMLGFQFGCQMNTAAIYDLLAVKYGMAKFAGGPPTYVWRGDDGDEMLLIERSSDAGRKCPMLQIYDKIGMKDLMNPTHSDDK